MATTLRVVANSSSNSSSSMPICYHLYLRVPFAAPKDQVRVTIGSLSRHGSGRQIPFTPTPVARPRAVACSRLREDRTCACSDRMNATGNHIYLIRDHLYPISGRIRSRRDWINLVRRIVSPPAGSGLGDRWSDTSHFENSESDPRSHIPRLTVAFTIVLPAGRRDFPSHSQRRRKIAGCDQQTHLPARAVMPHSASSHPHGAGSSWP